MGPVTVISLFCAKSLKKYRTVPYRTVRYRSRILEVSIKDYTPKIKRIAYGTVPYRTVPYVIQLTFNRTVRYGTGTCTVIKFRYGINVLYRYTYRMIRYLLLPRLRRPRLRRPSNPETLTKSELPDELSRRPTAQNPRTPEIQKPQDPIKRPQARRRTRNNPQKLHPELQERAGLRGACGRRRRRERKKSASHKGFYRLNWRRADLVTLTKP